MSARAMRGMLDGVPALSKASSSARGFSPPPRKPDTKTLPFPRVVAGQHRQNLLASPLFAMTPARYLERHQADLVRFTQQLVRLRTVNPPGENYGEITTFLAATLKDMGLEVRRIAVPRTIQKKTQPELLDFPRYNVLARWNVGAKKTIHLNAHFDVVPVSGEWRHGDPFNPAVEDGWIYGRGSSDMKGAIASIVFGLKALRETNTKPNFNVEVSFVADEETDSTLGTGWITSREKIRPDYAIVGEGGEGDSVCCGHNGVVWLNVHVHGRAAHGSVPHEGVNALEKMSALVLALGGYKDVLARKKFRTPDGRVMTPTINVGGVFSPGEGGKVNTVPASASFTIDRRVLPVETVTDAERDLRDFLKRAAARIPQCRITIEKISHNHSCFRDPATPFAAALRASVSRVRGRPAKFTVSTGFNDMHFFANELRLPTLGYGPGGENYHAVDERAKIKELIESAEIYADILTTFEG